MTWRIDDAEILEVVDAALAEGNTDLLDGGVHASTVAERLGYDRSSISTHLRQLEERGELVRVNGIDPETLEPRTSFLPADQLPEPDERLRS
jgi:biotin operon repressor